MRMECKEIFAALSEYIDGELPPGLCEQIESHIGDCPPCIEFVESLRKTLALTRSMAPAAPAPDLPAEAVERLRQIYQKHCASR